MFCHLVYFCALVPVQSTLFYPYMRIVLSSSWTLVNCTLLIPCYIVQQKKLLSEKWILLDFRLLTNHLGPVLKKIVYFCGLSGNFSYLMNRGLIVGGNFFPVRIAQKHLYSKKRKRENSIYIDAKIILSSLGKPSKTKSGSIKVLDCLKLGMI